MSLPQKTRLSKQNKHPKRTHHGVRAKSVFLCGLISLIGGVSEISTRHTPYPTTHHSSFIISTATAQSASLQASIKLVEKVAEELLEKGEFDRAIALYTEALANTPDSYDLLTGRGLAYHNHGDYSKALTDFNQAVAVSPNRYIGYYYQGLTYNELAQYDLAITAFNKSLQLNPKFSYTYYYRGEAYLFSSQYKLAIKDLQHFTLSQPDDADGYYYLGLAYHHTQQYDLAINQYNQAIKLNQKWQYYYLRAKSWLAQNKPSAALADLDQALLIEPKNTQLLSERANLRYAQKDFDGALTDYQQLLVQEPDNTIALLGRGKILHAQKKSTEALNTVNAGLDKHPNDSEFLWLRGQIYKALKKYPLALADIDQFIQQNPENGRGYWQRAYIYRQMFEFDAAMENIQRAITLAPKEVEFYAERARIYMSTSRYELALTDANHVITELPDKSWPYSMRANIHNLLYQFSAAEQDIKQAKHHGASPLDLKKAYAFHFMKQKKYQQVVELYESGLIEFPNDADLYYGKSRALVELKQYDLALAANAKAIELEPNYSVSRIILRGLILSYQHQYAAAKADLDAAIKEQPKFSFAHYALSVYHFERAEYPLALAAINTALSISPHTADLLLFRAQIHTSMGEAQLAQADAQKACDLGDCEGVNTNPTPVKPTGESS